MIVIFSILHYFGLAERVAKALNARRANKTLWSGVQIVGALVFLGIILKLGSLVYKISKDELNLISITTFTLIPALLITLFVTFEIVEMASWYKENGRRKLTLCPKGSWAMLEPPR